MKRYSMEGSGVDLPPSPPPDNEGEGTEPRFQLDSFSIQLCMLYHAALYVCTHVCVRPSLYAPACPKDRPTLL